MKNKEKIKFSSTEEEAKKNRTRNKFEQAILFALKTGVFIGLAILAPNALKILKTFGWIPSLRDPKYSLEKAVDRLKRKGLIVSDKKEGNDFYKVTQKGKLYLWKYESQQFKIKKPKKWDKRWRLIIFDIPEKHRFQRDATRIMLQNIGCVCLQNSVWVYPYDCEEVVDLLKVNYEIGEEVLYIIAEKIEGDEKLKKHFKIN
jgi:DNA-binding transcriptional regulator PaaX